MKRKSNWANSLISNQAKEHTQVGIKYLVFEGYLGMYQEIISYLLRKMDCFMLGVLNLVDVMFHDYFKKRM